MKSLPANFCENVKPISQEKNVEKEDCIPFAFSNEVLNGTRKVIVSAVKIKTQ